MVSFCDFGYKLQKSLHNVIMKYNVISSTLSKLSSSSPSYMVEVRDYSMSNIEIEFDLSEDILIYEKNPKQAILKVRLKDNM